MATNKTLRGIAIFGFGVIIPVELATPARRSATDNKMDTSQEATLTTTTPREPEEFDTQHIQQPHHSFSPLNNTSQSQMRSRRGSFASPTHDSGFNSPTRIPSTNNMGSLDNLDKLLFEQQTLPNDPHMVNYTTGPHHQQPTRQPQLLFSEQLMAQVVQKAEIGRVMMDIENI